MSLYVSSSSESYNPLIYKAAESTLVHVVHSQPSLPEAGAAKILGRRGPRSTIRRWMLSTPR